MPPLVMNDVLVVGPAHRVSMRPPSKENVKGDVRGYSAKTGEHLWTFRTIPQRGDVGYETWMNDGAEISGNAGVWAPLSGDLTGSGSATISALAVAPGSSQVLDAGTSDG